ncbi:MAG TPA: SpoIIE family protein phosphatase [Acidisarcina sp.]
MKRTLLALLWVAIFSACGLAAAAETFDASHLGIPASNFTGNWRVAFGDDPAWAAPSFDDSHWRLQPVDQKTAVDRRYIGFIWYRMHILLPAKHGPLSLSVNNGITSYEVYADGKHIGRFGGLPPTESRYEPELAAFPLGVAADAHSVEIAIRVWAHTISSIPGLQPDSVRIGDATAIANEVKEDQRLADEGNVQFWVVNAAYLLLSLVVLALFAFQPASKEYLWLAGWQLAGVVAGTISLLMQRSLIPEWTQFNVGIPLQFVSLVLMLEFYYSFVREHPGKGIRILELALLMTGALGPMILYTHPAPKVYGTLVVIPGLELLTIAVLITVMLVVWALRGNREAGLLLIPTLLANLSSVLNLAQEAGRALGWIKSQRNWLPITHFGDFDFSADTWFQVLFFIALLALLFYRFLNISRQQTRSAAEIEAARQVQQVLLPEQLLSIPGVTIESEYHPADVVGGDFFQVLPASDGSLLIVVGDVAGKGMGAAMLVGVIIGTIRTAVQFEQDPAAILATLNERLCGRVEGSFVTCLAGRLTSDGEFTVANAGHLSPYLNGEELITIPELPLGVTTGTVYIQSRFLIRPGDRLTFVSDGVVEAATAKGELFGFDRTREISRDPANAIAQAAKAFGQNDDFTVVTLTRDLQLLSAS